MEQHDRSFEALKTKFDNMFGAHDLLYGMKVRSIEAEDRVELYHRLSELSSGKQPVALPFHRLGALAIARFRGENYSKARARIDQLREAKASLQVSARYFADNYISLNLLGDSQAKMADSFLKSPDERAKDFLETLEQDYAMLLPNGDFKTWTKVISDAE